VAIVGSGFAGIGLAVRLRQAGIDDFVLLERAEDLGGTWRDNTYPGCRCDVPSHLYSFSFAPNPRWSRVFSPWDEILEYLRRCAGEHAITPKIRFGHEMLAAVWDEGLRRWEIETSGGRLSAQVLVTATGPLSEPSIPAIPGLGSFEGPAFHSAAWEHEHDLTGERVAVIGTGASAIQFVPQIQPRVERLHLFQRTPPWIVPRRDRAITGLERRMFRALPAAQLAARGAIYLARESLAIPFMHPRLMGRGERMAGRHLEEQVADPALRAKLTPAYRMGCKRVLISSDFYPAVSQPNVELVTDRIREVRQGSVVTEDGAEREVDAIILGTGFRVTDWVVSERLRGRGGALLADAWDGSPEAYKGTTVAGFPNMFMLAGPNTGLGHNSIIYMIESQVAYVMDCLRVMEERGVETVEVLPEAQAAFNEKVRDKMRGTVWTSGGCRSWYIDSKGRNSTLWPGFTWSYRHATRRFDPARYRLGRPARAAAAPIPV
jgi:cation diffusion facilitator CzcD-associated flavoprotein CzcO